MDGWMHAWMDGGGVLVLVVIVVVAYGREWEGKEEKVMSMKPAGYLPCLLQQIKSCAFPFG